MEYQSTCCCHATYSNQLTRYWMQKNLDVDYREIVEIPRNKIYLLRVFYDIFKWFFLVLTVMFFAIFWNTLFWGWGGGVIISLIFFFLFLFLTRFSGFLYYKCAVSAQMKATYELNRVNDRLNSRGLTVVVGNFCEWIEIHGINE